MLDRRKFMQLCERVDAEIVEEVLTLRGVQNMDANEAAFFARELESIKAQTFDILYPELRGRDFVPVDGSAGQGATQVTYQQFDRVGRAKIIAPNARDVPRVDVLGKEFPRPVRPWADAYGWTVFEVQSAAMINRNLNARKASAARRAIEEGLDETAAVGAPDYGIPTGVINDAAVPTQSVPNGGGGNPEWTTKTADEIIADVSAAVQRIVTASLGIHRPDTIILPDAQHALISTTPRSTQSDTTILEFILRSFPSITAIEPWYRLAGAGVGPSDRMIVYKRSADMLTQDITQEFTQLPTQEVGLEFVVNAFAQTAGTAIYYPLSMDYSDDI
jgi:hypothetical protein